MVQQHVRGAASEAAERDPLRNDDIPAAFWDTLPEDSSNEDMLAIQALKEESTPEERAEALKVVTLKSSSPASLSATSLLLIKV